MLAYFTGVHPASTAGHYCYAAGWQSTKGSDPPSPWAGESQWPNPLNEFGCISAVRQRLGLKMGGYDMGKQTEGEPLLLHKDGWTMLGMWDRSGDRRGGSCSAFAFQAVLTLDEAVAAARRLFPGVIERIEKHLGRSLTAT